MKKKGKVSIVIPIYNGAKYLPMLYDRLHNQTYDNIEIIMVDDFSTDGSYEMMQEFETQDLRFRAIQVLHKGGCAVKAQVQGMPYCTGEYYFYASQDDFFDYDIIEKCVQKAEEIDADIVLPNMILYYENKESLRHGKYPINEDYNQTLTGKEAFLLSLNWKLHAFALRKMSLFDAEEFKADYYNSEEYYFRAMLLRADKIAFCDSNFYYRQDNPEAITKSLKYFHVEILITDMMLFEIMMQQGYDISIIKSHLKELTLNWCRYCKRYALVRFPKEQRMFINKSLRSVGYKILYWWQRILRGKYEF